MYRNKNKQIKLRLWRSNQRCRNCGIKTIIHFTFGIGKIPDNAATLQHVYDKLHPLRDESKVILFCHKCNDEDNRERTKNHPKPVISHKKFLGRFKDRKYDIQYRGKDIGYIESEIIFINFGNDHPETLFEFIILCKNELTKINHG